MVFLVFRANSKRNDNILKSNTPETFANDIKFLLKTWQSFSFKGKKTCGEKSCFLTVMPFRLMFACRFSSLQLVNLPTLVLMVAGSFSRRRQPFTPTKGRVRAIFPSKISESIVSPTFPPPPSTHTHENGEKWEGGERFFFFVIST